MTIKISPQNKGFTLFEVLIALVIFAVVVAIMLPFFFDQRLQIKDNRAKSDAAAYSQEILEEIRRSDITTLPTTGSDTSRSKTVAGNQYNATVTYCANTTYCGSNSRDITVQVSYNGKTVYTVETVFTQFR